MKSYVIGPDPDSRGGIASVLANLRRAGLFENQQIFFVRSFVSESRARKLLVAIRAFFVLLIALLGRRVRAVHVHSAFGASFARKSLYCLLAAMFGRPVILQMHNGAFVQRYRASPRLWQAFVRFVYRRAACAIVLTSEQVTFLRTEFGHPRVERFPNPIVLPPEVATVPVRAVQAVYFATLTPAKGVYDLLNAWENVVNVVPNARLVLCGRGEDAEVQRVIRERGLQGTVQLAGWVSGKAKDLLLQESMVVVLPSHSEALPMSVLEGMAYGCVVVATDVGAIPDVVEDGATGRLVPVGDAARLATVLTQVFCSPADSAEIGRRARAQAESQFAADVVAKRYVDLYESLDGR
ncbi:MAG: glycosyltransferase family 4 protein [Burkholderiales bacterium]